MRPKVRARALQAYRLRLCEMWGVGATPSILVNLSRRRLRRRVGVARSRYPMRFAHSRSSRTMNARASPSVIGVAFLSGLS